MSASFMECPACDAKLGTPTLCDSCLNNRRLISDQGRTVKRLESTIKAVQSVLDLLRDKS